MFCWKKKSVVRTLSMHIIENLLRLVAKHEKIASTINVLDFLKFVFKEILRKKLNCSAKSIQIS